MKVYLLEELNYEPRIFVSYEAAKKAMVERIVWYGERIVITHDEENYIRGYTRDEMKVFSITEKEVEG